MASEDASPETLVFTPTWVLAAVCGVIVIISLFAERSLHYLGKVLKHKHQDALFQALQKLKEELMLLGFISLLLTVFQDLISKICIDRSVTSRMLLCKKENTHHNEVFHNGEKFLTGLRWNTRRLLSESEGSNMCITQGKVPLLSLEALHQLHIFIFVLAVVHVVFCATTMVLGGAKIRKWKHWESAIQKEHSKQDNQMGGEHPHAHHHLEFVLERARGHWRKSVVVSWMMSFFKQFHASVTKSDYKALRAGFVTKHGTNPNFDFHKYMMLTLEDDFKRVVGISWYLWLFVIIFVLLNVHGWHTYFWLSFLPLILLLAVGAKLEHIITRLALEIASNNVQRGQVKPSDEHFWFGKPGVVLYLIHFILFQNSFEIAFFFWIWSTYGLHSCMMESLGYLIPRLVIGLLIQVLCSYSTLPLYAIVTQMGDSFKQAIFAQQMQEALHAWAENVRKRKRSPMLRLFGHRNRKQSASDHEVQMQSTDSSCRSPHHDPQTDALDGMVLSPIEGSQPQRCVDCES